jgi:NAD(P)-dependent dehydrogenase (short-subunit alcohol dehydrogenase family)
MQTDLLAGKVILVTGGSSGLGRSMANAFAASGARVVLASPDIPLLEAAAVEIAERHGSDRVIAAPTDITVRADCDRVLAQTLEAFGALHVLVNNARRPQRGPGLPPDGNTLPFWQSNPDIWKEAVHVNVNGTFQLSHVVTPHLIAQGWGRIINISTSVETMQRRNNSPYGVTKAAIDAASLIWAQDLAGTGVTVNVLLPGGRVDTDPNRTPSPRSLSLDIMDQPAVWLASNLSDGVTGGRFVGKLWDASLPYHEAAARSRELPAIRPAL